MGRASSTAAGEGGRSFAVSTGLVKTRAAFATFWTSVQVPGRSPHGRSAV
jgi:hypothetical protein